MVIYLTRDLMFSSRVRPVVAQRDLKLVIVASPADVTQKLANAPAAEPPTAYWFIVDLKAITQPSDLGPLLTQVRTALADVPLRTLAYGPHVHVEMLQAATDAGFDTVMTQGQFDRGFSQWLAE